jgi:glycosyltransferase involved in cell wall biosynthesis
MGPVHLVGTPPGDAVLPPGGVRLGTLSESGLSDCLLEMNVLVLLSDMEGFGLPLVEAWAHGVSVVYRDAHSFREIMGPGAPGAWDGKTETFSSALEEAMTLPMEARREIAVRLAERFNWTSTAARFAQAVTKHLYPDAHSDSRDGSNLAEPAVSL